MLITFAPTQLVYIRIEYHAAIIR